MFQFCFETLHSRLLSRWAALFEGYTKGFFGAEVQCQGIVQRTEVGSRLKYGWGFRVSDFPYHFGGVHTFRPFDVIPHDVIS